jgi:hypothetical protein
MPTSLAFPLGSVFDRRSLTNQSVVSRLDVFDIQGGELRAAKAAGEPETQKRAIAEAGQVVGQGLDHAADVGRQQWRLTFWAVPRVRRIPFSVSLKGGLLHGCRGVMTGDLVCLSDGGESPPSS